MKTLKYKVITFGLIATLLFSSGCKDFLERDIEDGYSTESVETMNQYLGLTAALYGGTIWIGYHTKFNWVFNESLPGNLYQTFDEEGAVFVGNVAATNPHLKNGYFSLFSGVISSANYIINKDKPTLSELEAKQIEAEARMFRGLAYFLATEYWGEVPLVLNTEKDIADKVKVPKANRATIYKAIEMDWLFAAEHLPSNKWRDGRVNSWSAEGMLAKLYLTMASCQSPGLACPYVCPDPNEYYQKAIYHASRVIANSGASLVPYNEIFAIKSDKFNDCNESLFALHFSDFGYNSGSHMQAQFSMNQFWGPGSGWGGGKCLTYTLFESYKENDARKKEVCLYPNETFQNYKGEKAPDYKLTEGGDVKNSLKKYVYGYTSSHDVQSCPMRLDFLRLADVYLIRAEANMALAASDVRTPTTAGLEDLKKVLTEHAGKKIADDPRYSQPIAFYSPVPFTRSMTFDYYGYSYEKNNTPLTGEVVESVTIGGIPEERDDFIQERRKEFALEGQAWLDLKRLYYRCPQCAKDFLKEQDRGWRFTQRWDEADNDIPGQNITTSDMSGFIRTKLFNELYKKYPGVNPEVNITDEPPINEALASGNFDRWFLPIPADVESQLPPGRGGDYASELENGTYKW